MTVTRNETIIGVEPVVELRDVSRRFVKRRDRTRSFQDRFIPLLSRRAVQQEEFWPLRNVSLTIERGESVGIIGPNGSGKSTLLKLVTGILPPTSGDLTVNGRVCSLLELGAGFHPDLTGRENIYLNGSVYGLNRAQMNQRVDPIIEYAELGDFIDTPVKHYSSGMYVRLGFAIAIHTDPDLLLVDEVLAVGDAAFQHKCLASIRRFLENDGTLLFVSHDLDAVQSVCRRAIWIEDGDIRASGHPADTVMAYIGDVVAHEEERSQHRRDEDPAPWVARRHWGSGKVRITGVKFLNKEGEAATIFRNGGSMTIRIHYHAAERVEAPIFGLAIYHANGAHICGPNTQFGGLEIPFVFGDGSVDYRIEHLPFLEGDFVVSVAATNHEDTEQFDYHDRLYTFRVYPGASAERYGILTLAGSWRIKPDAARDGVPEGGELSPEVAN